MQAKLLLLKYVGRARASWLLLCALACGGCNGDVFIDEFMSGEPPTVSIGQEGETVTIPFEADNWGICSLSSFYNPFGVQVTDLEGNDLHLPMEEGQTGIVRTIDDFLDLEAVKRNGREVELTLRENLYDNPVELDLVVGNGYEEKTIPVRVASGSKYRVDSVAYDWGQFFTYDYKAEWVYSIIVDNTQGTDTTWAHVRPYEKAVRRVRFSIPGEVMGKDYYTTLLGDPLPEVTIPDVADGKPVVQDTRVTFDLEEQDLPVDLDKDFTVLVPVPGGKKMEVGAYVSVEHYDVPFVIHCSHPHSGRTRTFSGTLSSDRPYDYFYTLTDLTHTDE